ncbi:hypothetical protein DESC_340041 [Desulfosarcina cetonica]|nr:hypothetical protein DESC_340041 [Desulfosarcina cetonica]
MRENDYPVVFPGPFENRSHIQTNGRHHRGTHVGFDIIGVKSLKIVDVVKVNQNMRAFLGGDFDTRYRQQVIVTIKFDSAGDGVVVGNGQTDAKTAGVLGNLRDRVGTIGMAGVKMKVNHRVFRRQCIQTRFLELDTVEIVHSALSVTFLS